MRTARIAGNVLLAVYLWITFCAFMLTILRVRMYFPYSLVRYSYGMMAPYQSFSKVRGEALAEGELPDGSWQVIDLASYYPVLLGERSIREERSLWANHLDDEAVHKKYREHFARKLLELERAQGREYRAIRLSWQTWPSMTGEYRQLKQPAFTDTQFLYEYDADTD